MSEPLLPKIAAKVAEWFPELDGRSIAVSEAEITRENVPTLPLAMVALLKEKANHAWKSSTDEMSLSDSFVIEFWLETARYKRKDGGETPFWAFFNYEPYRDKLLSRLLRWTDTGGYRIEYKSMDIESDAFAITICFTFEAHFGWCAEEFDDDEKGIDFTIRQKICTPKTQYCGECFERHEKECDPCQ